MTGRQLQLARLAAWVARALGTSGSFATDLETDALGFSLPEQVRTDPGVRDVAATVGATAATLSTAADALAAAADANDKGAAFRGGLAVFEGVYRLVDALGALVAKIDARAQSLPPADRDATTVFTAMMTRKTIDWVVVSALETELPRIALLLKLLGLIDAKPLDPPPGSVSAIPRKDLHLEWIGRLIADPANHFKQVYGWNTAGFDPSLPMATIGGFYPVGASVDYGVDGQGDPYLNVGPARWRRDSSAMPPGLALDYPVAIGGTSSARTAVSADWGVGVKADLSASGGVSYRLRPEFESSLAPLAGTVGGKFRLEADRNPDARDFTVLDAGLLAVAVENVAIGAEMTVGAAGSGAVAVDPSVFAELDGLTVTLGTAGADGFLAKLLGGATIEGAFDIALMFSLGRGLVVRAGGGLEVAIPIHRSLGPVSLDILYLILKFRDDGSFAFEVSAAVSGRIGPLTAVVERMGVEVTAAFVDGADADLGPLALGLRFKPPNGVGLALDAGIVRGGGYLYLDYEAGEYAGAMELVFAGFLAVKAIGLISTKLPDGSDGFSLLVVVTAEFGVPLQLGFGFTLVGLGGLLGLNRSMLLDELAEGVRTGAVESVMFPHDVIANAPQIVSDLRRFFPAQEDSFLIGPMMKLGWGTPTLISASVGVVVVAPPGDIALLGVVKCALPHEDLALLLLQVKFIGAIEPGKKRLWFFASLFGSRVLWTTIGGETGLLLSWGDDANFVLSVGGFHPQFTPPPLPFPTPQRISFALIDTKHLRLRVDGYFAVTPNTAQFGASVNLYVGAGDFAVEGHLGFDALFQFSPFHFEITFSASMSVKVFGAGVFSVRIRGTLDGPAPWHVTGHGSISVLFFDFDVPFSLTWGESTATTLEAIAALPLLKAELEQVGNWRALAPAGGGLSVTLRTIDAAAELVLHPVGALSVSQRAIPLGVAIQKVGNRAIADVARLDLTVADGLVERKRLKERFATGQYRTIDGTAQLSAPGYEPYDAGLELTVAGADTRVSHAVKRVVTQELIVIDSDYKRRLERFFKMAAKWFAHLLSSNATARSRLSRHHRRRRVPFHDAIRVTTPGFVIVSAATNQAWSMTATFASHAEAVDALAAHAANDPAAAGALQVIPLAEMAA